MRSKASKIASFFLLLAAICAMLACSVSALSWDGSTAGGDGHVTIDAKKGYALRKIENNCIAYRFSAVDKNGVKITSKVIDVFRNTTYGNYGYKNNYKFVPKYNKKEMIQHQNGHFSTAKNTTNCFTESGMGFATKLPNPSDMRQWQNVEGNLQKVLAKLGAGSLSSLKYGDKIIVEPLYDVRLENVYHAATVTEIAIYGKHILGVNSNGGSSKNSESWGFISNYVNKLYPNELYTPDGQGLWPSAAPSHSRLTFYTIINKGYGVGIAYTSKTPDFSPNLAVKQCEAWSGAKGMKSSRYGVSTGPDFDSWTYDRGYPKTGDKVWFAVHFPAEKQNCYVRQTVSVVGGGASGRRVWSDSGTWYDVQLYPDTVDANRSAYEIKARVDWLHADGSVKKYGVERTFYIPVKPIIHRQKVQVLSMDGTIPAYAGEAGSGGKVYVGQRIYPQYVFTAENRWTSYHSLRGQMQEWVNQMWRPVYNSSETLNHDLYKKNKGMQASSPYTGTSQVGLYTVPDNTLPQSDFNCIPFTLRSYWEKDSAHTMEISRYEIPITKADVVLGDIILTDKDRYPVNPQELEAGQEVCVYYKYLNNTECTVYVNGYRDDRSRIEGTYAIRPGSAATVYGYSFTVPDKKEFAVWGGVYLDGVPLYHTAYEKDGTNNTKTLTCKVTDPLELVLIEPNAPYREQTSVMTSYYLVNNGSKDVLPSDNISIRFQAFTTDGTVVASREVKQVVVPKHDKNIVYFKWYVPSDLINNKINIIGQILKNGQQGKYVFRLLTAIDYETYSTPDTKYEAKAPDGFRVPAPPQPQPQYATWWEYTYANGRFTKTSYAVGLPASDREPLEPAPSPVSPMEQGKWKMKSGYGVWLEVSGMYARVSGFRLPSPSSFTEMQYGYAAYPEFRYAFGKQVCTTLVRNPSGNAWALSAVNALGTNKQYHYTPLYFPDGDYVVKVVCSDMWTPTGMVSSVSTTKPITICGNAYDDWYVGRK